MQEQLKQIFKVCVDTLIKFIQKLPSKKFFVWLIATHMTYIGLLDPQSWLFVALIWMGIEGGLDWKGLPTETIKAAASTTAPFKQRYQQLPPVPSKSTTL